jgi:hypothetical protein
VITVMNTSVPCLFLRVNDEQLNFVRQHIFVSSLFLTYYNASFTTFVVLLYVKQVILLDIIMLSILR